MDQMNVSDDVAEWTDAIPSVCANGDQHSVVGRCAKIVCQFRAQSG